MGDQHVGTADDGTGRAGASQPPVDRKSLYKAFAAALSGTTMEWYDFAVYSAASALVLGTLFFPSEDPYVATISAFSTYAVGYVSRPIGGVVFGRLGDIIGRKRVLVITLLMIGIATFLIGILPTYQHIGTTAAVLLVALRFIQGVGVGGEWGGAVLLSSEYGDPHRRGFWASAAQVGPPLGNLLANGILAILTVSMSADSFLSWGWRVAFLFSAVLVAFGLWIRLKLEDTPVFHALQESGDRSEKPLSDVLTTQGRQLLSAVLARLGPDVFYSLYTVFIISYGVQHLEMERSQVLVSVLIGSGLQVAWIPLAGWASDLVNRRLLYAIGAIGAAVWSFVLFAVVQPGSVGLLIVCIAVAGILHSVMYGPQAAYVIEQFHPRLRYTGASLAYTIAGVFGGALAPLMFTLVAGPEGRGAFVALYVAVACTLTLIGLALGRNSAPQEDLDYIGADQSEAAQS
ncbi:MFS transporter [Brachybacterium endophyticum]|uniref:Putative proline/betaine transporter n=1 Tax=Brachybacterium endophyticum TaxID=2182385 RepID=A0A2U2RIP5_9MICO|nr:MFS transporter [Brachybacterium endophyticum]PWH05711.1 MFS transporter [Brachybacterium endophyticum]